MSGQAQFVLKIFPKDQCVALESFTDLLNHTFLSLKQLHKEMFGEDEAFVLHVKSINLNSPGSAVFTEGEATNPSHASDTFDRMGQDFSYIRENNRFPDDVTHAVIESYSKMIRTLNNGLESFSIKTPNLNEQVATRSFQSQFKQATEFEKAQYYDQWTSFDGWLKFLNVYSTPHYFRIYDVLIDRHLKCVFPKELKAQVKQCVDQRVTVYGKVLFNRMDQPVEMQVKRIELCPTGDMISRFEDLHTFSDAITEGLDASEYIRRNRYHAPE
mgnify:CR=1 FL=1